MTSDRVVRVRMALAVARRLADPGDPLGMQARQRLPATSGLSPEGVTRALERHLETAASDTQIQQLVAACPPATRCHVVLAANVCTAPLRALACALACSEDVTLKPSRRDPVVAELLVAGLQDELRVRLAERVTPRPGEALHVYGSDATIETLRRTAAQGVRFWGHGTGLGVAVVSAYVDLEDAAARFATDLIAFDGQGCLSPRIVWVEGDAARAEAFARAAHEALLAEAVPRGPLSGDDASALARYRRTMMAIGEVLDGPDHLLALDPGEDPGEAQAAVAVGPALRCAVVAPSHDGRLGALASRVAAVGVAGEGALADAVFRQAPRARQSTLGAMQSPPLDGPVDRRNETVVR
jgi:Acyl-CoA reductase (LuxC)